MIPPTFTEIGQLMFKSILEYFKHDADHSAQPPIANDQRFEPPTEKVSGNKQIQLILDIVEWIVGSLVVV